MDDLFRQAGAAKRARAAARLGFTPPPEPAPPAPTSPDPPSTPPPSPSPPPRPGRVPPGPRGNWWQQPPSDFLRRIRRTR